MGGWIEPTARGDMEADLMRRWYEKNREGFFDRHQINPLGASTDRSGAHADEFMLRLMGEAARISNMDDDELAGNFR